MPTRLSRRLLPAMLFRMTGKIWDLFLLFVGLGLGALGIVNSSTSSTWLVLAVLCLLALLVHRLYLALAARRDGRSSATQVALDFEGVQIGRTEIHRQVGLERVAAGSNYVAPENRPSVSKIESHSIEIAWVRVHNPGKGPQQDAKEVMAVISVTKPDGSACFEYQGRWRQSPERWQVGSSHEVSDRVAIPAARGSTLDIVFKYEGESSAYGLNTESTELAPDWRYKRWELPPGEYLVRVEVTGENVRPLVGWFKVSNPGDRPLSLESSPRPKGARDVPIALTADLIPDGHIESSGWTSSPIGYSGWTASGIAPEPVRPANPEAQTIRRDEQIGSAPILKVGKPSFTYGSREMTLEVENASASMAFSPCLRLRASRQLVGPPNWEPSTAATELLLSLPDAIAPGDRATFRGVLNDFVDMAKLPEIPLWPSQIFCDITMNGILGQRVLQRYEWAPAGRDGHYFWQRVVEVTPTDGVPVRLGS